MVHHLVDRLVQYMQYIGWYRSHRAVYTGRLLGYYLYRVTQYLPSGVAVQCSAGTWQYL